MPIQSSHKLPGRSQSIDRRQIYLYKFYCENLVKKVMFKFLLSCFHPLYILVIIFQIC